MASRVTYMHSDEILWNPLHAQRPPDAVDCNVPHFRRKLLRGVPSVGEWSKTGRRLGELTSMYCPMLYHSEACGQTKEGGGGRGRG